MNDLEKLKHLIGHWIEHEREHARAYEEWARKIQHLDGGTEIAFALVEAAKKLYESVEYRHMNKVIKDIIMMNKTIIVTGEAGFIGRNILNCMEA